MDTNNLEREPSSPQVWARDEEPVMTPTQSFSSEDLTPPDESRVRVKHPGQHVDESCCSMVDAVEPSIMYLPASQASYPYHRFPHHPTEPFPHVCGYNHPGSYLSAFPDRMDHVSFTSPESSSSNSRSKVHAYGDRTTFLEANYTCFPHSNPISVSREDHPERGHNQPNCFSEPYTLPPILTPLPQGGPPGPVNHSLNIVPHQGSAFGGSYYASYQPPSSRFDQTFDPIEFGSYPPATLSEPSSGVDLVFQPNPVTDSRPRTHNSMEDQPSRLSPSLLPDIRSSINSIDGRSSASDSPAYDNFSSNGDSAHNSRAGSETLSRPLERVILPEDSKSPVYGFDPESSSRVWVRRHKSSLKPLDQLSETAPSFYSTSSRSIDSGINFAKSSDGSSLIGERQREALISNAVQHLTAQVPRRRLTVEQEQILLKRFAVQEYLSKREMEELAEKLKIPTSQLRTWFGNRRSKLKAAARQRAKLEAGMGNLSDAELKSLNKRITGSSSKTKALTKGSL